MPNFKPQKPKSRKGEKPRRIQTAALSTPSFPGVRTLGASTPFPNSMTVDLPYAYSLPFTTSAVNGYTLSTEQVFRLNSLYDPDYTGAGHQPYGFDQFAALYSRYKVESVEVEILFTTPGGAYDMVGVVQVASPANTNSLSGVNYWLAMEQPGTSIAHIPSSGERKGTFHAKLPIANVVGLQKKQFDDNIEDYSALVSTNPSRTPWLRIAACCYANGGTNQTIQATIRLKYRARFWDRIVQGSS